MTDALTGDKESLRVRNIEVIARQLVGKHLDRWPLELIQRDSNFFDDLGADSLDNVELIMAFEEEFRIEVSDDDAERVQTFGDAVDLVAQLTGEKAGPKDWGVNPDVDLTAVVVKDGKVVKRFGFVAPNEKTADEILAALADEKKSP